MFDQDHLKTIEAILLAKADVNARMPMKNINAIDMAVSVNTKKSIGVVKKLIAHKADVNNVGSVRVSIHTGGRMRILTCVWFAFQDGNGCGLHGAAQLGAVSMLELLLAAGGNPNIIKTNKYYGATPMMSACQYGHLPVVKLLLRHKANVNAKARRDACTALHIVSFQRGIPIFAKKAG